MIKLKFQFGYFLLAVCFGMLWIGGVFFYWTGQSANLSTPYAGPLLLTTGFLLTAGYQANVIRNLFALTFAGMVGFVIEVIGVRLGIPFGTYSYTETFQPQLWDVPIVMVCAWGIFAGFVHDYVISWTRNLWIRVFLGGLCLPILDLIVDPAAAGPMKLWVWTYQGGYYGVPLSNFFGWFITSLAVMGCILFLTKGTAIGRSGRLVGIFLILFFTLINIAYDLSVPGILGVCVVVAAISLEFQQLHSHKITKKFFKNPLC